MKNIINFIEAARSGKLDELGALKTKAGGIDVHNNAGETALIAAAKSSRQEVVEW
ncbi:MAG: ankyrin repeat domain-containing protein, partial [Alphaproteobacteria bacterium]|nr:ankyrin repeat domain-containing protein [Alphaproteobacteria bacterium]